MEINKLLLAEPFSRRLRIGMELADMTVKELSYELKLHVNTIYGYRSECIPADVPEENKIQIFEALERRKAGTIKKLLAIELIDIAEKVGTFDACKEEEDNG